MAIPAVDLRGCVFFRLTVLHRTTNRWGCVRWVCQCTCGKKTVACSSKLKGGTAKSCGCFRLESVTTHGASSRGKPTREYRSWLALVRRCEDPKKSPKYYFGEVRVCRSWRHDFSAFLKHIGPSPGAGYTVERKNNKKGYVPGNVKWATAREQAHNRRNNLKLTVHGRTQNVAQWSTETGIKFTTIWQRLARGWSAHQAVMTPVKL